MSARFNVTRSSSDSQTYPPFAVQVDSETSKDRDQFFWSRSFAFAIVLVGGFRISDFELCSISERRESEINRLRLK